MDPISTLKKFTDALQAGRRDDEALAEMRAYPGETAWGLNNALYYTGRVSARELSPMPRLLPLLAEFGNRESVCPLVAITAYDRKRLRYLFGPAYAEDLVAALAAAAEAEPEACRLLLAFAENEGRCVDPDLVDWVACVGEQVTRGSRHDQARSLRLMAAVRLAAGGRLPRERVIAAALRVMADLRVLARVECREGRPHRSAYRPVVLLARTLAEALPESCGAAAAAVVAESRSPEGLAVAAGGDASALAQYGRRHPLRADSADAIRARDSLDRRFHGARWDPEKTQL